MNELDTYVKKVEDFLKNEFPQYEYSWDYASQPVEEWILYREGGGFRNRVMSFNDELLSDLNSLQGIDALEEMKKYIRWSWRDSK